MRTPQSAHFQFRARSLGLREFQPQVIKQNWYNCIYPPCMREREIKTPLVLAAVELHTSCTLMSYYLLLLYMENITSINITSKFM